MVGVFDSGTGGLHALRILLSRRPDRDYLYFADTAGRPYGEKSVAWIRRRTRLILTALMREGAREILAACGTVSTLAPDLLSEKTPYLTSGILRPAVSAAAATGARSVALLATRATVSHGGFTAALRRALPEAELKAVSCQSFVLLSEAGLTDPHDPLVMAAVRSSLAPLLPPEAASPPELLLLGCTHFSSLDGAIGALLPKTRRLSCADCAALRFARALPMSDPAERVGRPRRKVRYLVSDHPEAFLASAAALGFPIPPEDVCTLPI